MLPHSGVLRRRVHHVDRKCRQGAHRVRQVGSKLVPEVLCHEPNQHPAHSQAYPEKRHHDGRVYLAQVLDAFQVREQPRANRYLGPQVQKQVHREQEDCPVGHEACKRLVRVVGIVLLGLRNQVRVLGRSLVPEEHHNPSQHHHAQPQQNHVVYLVPAAEPVQDDRDERWCQHRPDTVAPVQNAHDLVVVHEQTAPHVQRAVDEPNGHPVDEGGHHKQPQRHPAVAQRVHAVARDETAAGNNQHAQPAYLKVDIVIQHCAQPVPDELAHEHERQPGLRRGVHLDQRRQQCSQRLVVQAHNQEDEQ